jgi:hypothetical protein
MKPRFKNLALALLAVGAIVSAGAMQNVGAQTAPPSLGYVALGYQQITATGTAASLTVPAGAKMAVISVETAAIRWRDDGVDPTTTVGMPVAAAATPIEYSGPLANFRLIAQTGSPIVNVSYYR